MAERWNISMRVKRPSLSNGQGNLASGTVILGFDYETQNVAKLKMDALAVVNMQNLPSLT